MQRPPSAYVMWLNSGGRNIVQAEFANETADEQDKQAKKKWDNLDWKSKKHWQDQHDREYEKFSKEEDQDDNLNICKGPKDKQTVRSKEAQGGTKEKQIVRSKEGPVNENGEGTAKSGGSSGTKRKKVTKKRPNPVVKLKLDENAIKKKVECAKKDKKVSRFISKEAHDESAKSSIIKAYEYKGKGPLVTFGGVHNKHGAKITNSITIPLDILPIAGTTKESLIEKCQNKSTSDVSHILKIHPDKAFGYTKKKMNTGTRILSSIQKDLVDEIGLPKINSKGAKPKKMKTSPMMFATETEKHCVAASVINRISGVANEEQKRKLVRTFSKITRRHPYQKMDHGVGRAVMQAMWDFCEKKTRDAILEDDEEVEGSVIADKEVEGSVIADKEVEGSVIADKEVEGSVIADKEVEGSVIADTNMEENILSIEESTENVVAKKGSDSGGQNQE